MIDLLKKIKYNIKLSLLNAKWRKKNNNNFTKLGLLCNINNIKVGHGTYGIINAYDFNQNSKIGLNIKNYCSIAHDVTFILAGEHHVKYLSTYPFDEMYYGSLDSSISKGKITIESDVWICHGATILSGVTIGQGAIVGAGAVVNKDVPPYSVVVGVPARVVKYRFSDEIICELLNINYDKIDKKCIDKCKKILKKEINNLDDAREIVDYMRNLYE